MPINFSKLTSSANQVLLEPRDIFMSLPNKDKSYGYPRDVQTEVWKQWFDLRDNKNLIIKMNTGSGKTVVGLTILQSCLNEGKGPAVYIVPDNYLVTQVCREAEKLGIRVAYDKYNAEGIRTENGEDDYFFTNKKAILIANIHKLVNGKSIFGLRPNGNIQIGSIIIDDVHACLDSIEQQYTVRIDSGHLLYPQIIQKLGQYQEIQESQDFYNITINQSPGSHMLIPFWIWQKTYADIYRLISSQQEDPITLFNLPLLESNWKTCNCVISAQGIEITPKCIPISKIACFERAQRRIFMSATLADDSVFVSTLGLHQDAVANIITPENANDIGDRLILFPKHLNAALDDDNVKQTLGEIANTHNVVVIVPSFERIGFWRSLEGQVPLQVLSARDKNIEKGVASLKQGTFKGLTVLVNKYDGIDLPDDACRFLVIDGLPAMRSEYDIVTQRMNPLDKRICREHIQKIEQGMGRGVRSNSDFCVIVFMGNKLADVIVNQGGDEFFSKATSEQYRISKQLWEQLMESGTKPTIEDIFGLADYVLSRDPDWIDASRRRLSSVEYERNANIDRTIVAIRNAFDKESIERFDEAFGIIEKEKNENPLLDNDTKGILMQLMAEYKNFSNPSNAQEILLAAQKQNCKVLKPINGIQHEKLQCSTESQGANVVSFIKEHDLSGNNYLIRVCTILDNLFFSEDLTDEFEEAVNNVAAIIGIHASRPERGGVKGAPDNLWAIGNREYLVIECKSGVKPDIAAISKADCAQLLSSTQWFENLYAGNGFKCHPIMIHRVSKFDDAASPNPHMRVMTEELLNQFKSAIRAFAQAVACNNITDAREIQKLLTQHKLNGKAIIEAYTVVAKI